MLLEARTLSLIDFIAVEVPNFKVNSKLSLEAKELESLQKGLSFKM